MGHAAHSVCTVHQHWDACLLAHLGDVLHWEHHWGEGHHVVHHGQADAAATCGMG